MIVEMYRVFASLDALEMVGLRACVTACEAVILVLTCTQDKTWLYYFLVIESLLLIVDTRGIKVVSVLT